MFQGEYVDGRARLLQQSIFIPFWICVVDLCGRVCVSWKGISQSLWMFPCLSRLPASPCARIKAHFCPRPSYLPHITTASPNNSTQPLLIQLSFIWPYLCLLPPIITTDRPRAPSQRKRIHPTTLKREKIESDGC